MQVLSRFETREQRLCEQLVQRCEQRGGVWCHATARHLYTGANKGAQRGVPTYVISHARFVPQQKVLLAELDLERGEVRLDVLLDVVPALEGGVLSLGGDCDRGAEEEGEDSSAKEGGFDARHEFEDLDVVQLAGALDLGEAAGVQEGRAGGAEDHATLVDSRGRQLVAGTAAYLVEEVGNGRQPS